MEHAAFGAIDEQRGFMPPREGIKLNLPGFGELAVPNGQEVVAPTNLLLARFALKGLPTFTTQDWHPNNTGHFSSNPDFKTTWPIHCVRNTAGASFHPNLELPSSNENFRKGTTTLRKGEEDKSYSGLDGRNANGVPLAEWLKSREITSVVLAGLALDYCVKYTAIDLNLLGLRVIVALDATRSINEESTIETLGVFKELGIHTLASAYVLTLLEAA